jgi:hypothetical protein
MQLTRPSGANLGFNQWFMLWVRVVEAAKVVGAWELLKRRNILKKLESARVLQR